MCLLGTVDAAAAATNPYLGFGNRLAAVVGRLRAITATSAAEKNSAAAAAAAGNTASALLTAYEHGAAAGECNGRGEECPLDDYFLLEAQSERAGKARAVRRRRKGRRRKRESSDRRPGPGHDPGAGATKETARVRGPPYDRRRLKAVQGAGGKRRSPNRRAWLNVSRGEISLRWKLD